MKMAPRPVGRLLCAVALACSCRASITSGNGTTQTLVPKMQQIRQKLRVITASKGLTPALTKEAKHVLEEADQALEKPTAKSAPMLEAAFKDYKDFVSHLIHRSEELTRKDKELSASTPKDTADMTPAEREAKAAKLVPILAEKVQKLLLHISQEKGLNQTQVAARNAVEKTLRDALADSNSSSIDGIHRAVGLHEAMVEARNYVQARSSELDKEEARLGKEIEEGTERMLLAMLMQRRKLPLQSQLAILKRKQFANCSVAHQLLKKHDRRPLFDQLMSILPEDVVSKYNKTHAPKQSGHLAAAGSGGRVQVVSSRLRNQVTKMIAELKATRDKLVTMAKYKVGLEAKQAKQIAAGLDEMLTKIGQTKDLKRQLEMMDQVEGKLGSWASSVEADSNATASNATASHAKKIGSHSSKNMLKSK